MSNEEKRNEEEAGDKHAHVDGSGRLGIPISDDSSEDEASQIIALQEDQGIYYHEEVVAPPKYESDDEDILVGGKRSLERQTEVEHIEHLDHDDSLEMTDDDDGRDTASRMGRRRSVRFTGPYDQEEDGTNQHLRSPSPESLRYIKALENPMSVKDDDEKSQDEEAFEELVKGPKDEKHPLGSPPAYTSGDEQKKLSLPPQPTPLEEPKPPAKKTRGSLNELLLTKVAQPFQNMMRRASRMEEDSTSEDEDDEDDDYTEEEIQVLTYIDAFKPVEIELKPQLRPFVLDFIPAIGEIDGFVKIPRPDEVDDNNGLTSLDEPAAQQSDATILNMQLRNVSKEVGSSSKMDDPPVKQLQRADKNSNEIEKWISNIKELHKTKPAQTVHYKGVMPDMDTLMQEWPSNLEEKMKNLKLPSSELDVSTDEYADILLNMFDIPVSKSRVHSLHLLFSLMSEFNNSQHFRNLAQNNKLGGETGETMDRLEL
ncbi:unnamed protein product [Caenorhabditis angaria]|uniref:Intraflagellar transport protein 46 homolog n=1 Tax=Caenorhabditis angaria TaxID=860376 RepID=A0A9P1N8U3_9PELO|nr:unnamed protein product [Caenorhabditis angaria]